AEGVRLRVTNPGPADPRHPSPGHTDPGRTGPDVADAAPVAPRAEGQGIPGMRERARLYGGTLTARPSLRDCWQVEAWLPYAAVPDEAG
nr:hypothetical protein [Micromonospora sp. DSM 115978]